MSSLHVAMQSGPYHHPVLRMSGVWSLRVPGDLAAWPSLLITCTGRIVTMLKNHGTARYSQASQHIAGCSPHRHRCGGQRIYLRQLALMSPWGLDHIFIPLGDVRRMASEDSLAHFVREPFLLIACTHRIVTSISNYHYSTGSVGFPGVPANSRIW